MRTVVVEVHPATFGADDKELEAIFTRTYGESKRKLSYDSGPRQVVYDAGTYNRTKKEEPVEEYLLVDGYNILYAWDELRELMKVTLDGARHRLMDMLCNYQGYRRCNLIVVFVPTRLRRNRKRTGLPQYSCGLHERSGDRGPVY